MVFPILYIILILVNVFIYHKVGWILILLRREKKNYNSMYVSLLVYIYTSGQSYYSVQSSLWLVYTSMHMVVSPFYYLSEEYIRAFAKVSLLPMTCYYYFGFLCEFDFSTPFESYAFPGVVLSIIK